MIKAEITNDGKTHIECAGQVLELMAELGTITEHILTKISENGPEGSKKLVFKMFTDILLEHSLETE